MARYAILVIVETFNVPNAPTAEGLAIGIRSELEYDMHSVGIRSIEVRPIMTQQNEDIIEPNLTSRSAFNRKDS